MAKLYEPLKPKGGPVAEPLTSTIESISGTIAEVKEQWKEFKPFLVGSGGVAILAGLLQVIACLLILCSGPTVKI
jgi:hypothetical protein